MVLYPSQEWCDDWKKAINADEVIAKTGQNWSVAIQWKLVICPHSRRRLKHSTHVYLEAAAGKCSDARLVDVSSDVDPGFIVTGSYPDFKSVVKGEAHFLAGVVKGTFKIKGDMVKIMRNAKFIRAVANSISSFESEYFEG